jgi:hypothetical protein
MASAGLRLKAAGRAGLSFQDASKGEAAMSTTRQKEAARKNIAKAREVQSERAHGVKIPRQTRGLSTSQEDKLPDKDFAFPKERKEPLTDAKHVRNAVARFDQVEGVTDAERDKAWKRIRAAAKRFDVDVSESDWRDLYKGNKKAAKGPAARASTAKGSAAKASTTRASTARASATKAPTAKGSTTKAPTARASTTKAPTAKGSTTKAPTARGSATKAPTAKGSTTKAPTARASTARASTAGASATKGSATKASAAKAPTAKSSKR